MSTKAKIQHYVDEIRNTINHACWNYEIWWVYEGKGREQYLDVMNQYLMFFRESIHAHFVALIIALYRLFEPRKDTCNFPELIKLFEREKIIDTKTRKYIEPDYQKAQCLWKKVAILRNNIYAHRKNKMSYKEIYAKAKITPNQIRDLIALSKKIINTLTMLWNNNTYAFYLSATGNTKQLLTDLKKIPEL